MVRRSITKSRSYLSDNSCFSLNYALAHAAGHLQLDQAVQLNRVLHGKLLGDRLNEAIDDQRVGFGLVQATAHQVEELILTNFGDGGFVADLGLVLLYPDGWVGIGASILVEQECVTANTGFGVVCTRVDTDQTSIGGSTCPLGNRLRENSAMSYAVPDA